MNVTNIVDAGVCAAEDGESSSLSSLIVPLSTFIIGQLMKSGGLSGLLGNSKKEIVPDVKADNVSNAFSDADAKANPVPLSTVGSDESKGATAIVPDAVNTPRVEVPDGSPVAERSPHVYSSSGGCRESVWVDGPNSPPSLGAAAAVAANHGATTTLVACQTQIVAPSAKLVKRPRPWEPTLEGFRAGLLPGGCASVKRSKADAEYFLASIGKHINRDLTLQAMKKQQKDNEALDDRYLEIQKEIANIEFNEALVKFCNTVRRFSE